MSFSNSQEINDSRISSKCFDVFTPHRVVRIIAEYDEVCKKFYTSLHNFIKNHMDPENFANRVEAAQVCLSCYYLPLKVYSTLITSKDRRRERETLCTGGSVGQKWSFCWKQAWKKRERWKHGTRRRWWVACLLLHSPSRLSVFLQEQQDGKS